MTTAALLVCLLTAAAEEPASEPALEVPQPAAEAPHEVPVSPAAVVTPAPTPEPGPEPAATPVETVAVPEPPAEPAPDAMAADTAEAAEADASAPDPDPRRMTIEQAADLLAQREAAAKAKPAAAPQRPTSRVVAAAEALDAANDRFQDFALGAFDDLQHQRMTQPAQILVGAVSSLLVLLLGFLIRIARGRGEIQVCVAYPLEMKGTFSIRLAQRRSGARPSRI
ncbi:MAG TPA: hypothetical protein VFY49_17295, partial [Myxococcota bacterium]|nr:hypothetical protein [Myxococcota bacterium]